MFKFKLVYHKVKEKYKTSLKAVKFNLDKANDTLMVGF